MPFMHAMIDGKGTVRPCCSWDIEVDSIDDPWPNMQDGLHNAVTSEKFQRVRNALLNKQDVDGCRRCHFNEKTQGMSFRLARLERDADWIANTEFHKDLHQMRYMETGFSSLCNLSCRMCWEGVSSTFHRITRPGQKIKMGYNHPIEKYDVDLSDMTEIKIVGGEPLMEQKHDEFIERLLDEHADLSQLHIIYHTNCTVLPSKRVQEVWKKCRKIELSMSIDSYGYNNWEQRPGPYQWEDLVKVTDQFKRWSEEWGNIQLQIGAVLTKINVFHMHELIDWVNTYWEGTKGWNNLGFNTAERPHELSIQSWQSDTVKMSKVRQYADTLPDRYKRQLIAGLEGYSGSTIPGFVDNMKKLDEYYGYTINEYL